MKAHILKINGRVVTREEFEAHPRVGGGGPPMTCAGLLPMSHDAIEGYSISASLASPTADRVAAENKFCRDHGVQGVRFEPAQRHNCRITSNKGFKKYMKLKKLYNADGGY